MLTTVFHSKIFITNLMTGKCHHQPSSFLSRTFPPLPQDRHQHIFHEPEHDYQLTLFHPRRSWTMWFSILRSRLTRPLVRLTSAFPIPPTRFLRRSICLSVRRGSFRDLSTFTNQFCSLKINRLRVKTPVNWHWSIIKNGFWIRQKANI